jgi:hypothetical protein
MNVKLVNHWNSYLASLNGACRDVYFSEEYVYLYQSADKEPYCVVAEEEGCCMLFPFLRRTFEYKGETYYDFETAYGYGGPIFNTSDRAFRNRALYALAEVLKSHSYVAGFIRFHPLLSNYDQFEEIGEVRFDRETIAINTALDEDELWMHEIHLNNRNKIKKAEKRGLTFVVDDAYIYLPDFIRLYNATMDKLSANSFYYFDESYYRKIKEEVKSSFLGVVKYEHEVIAAAIIFYGGPYAHYHLGGSNKATLNLRPNNYLLYMSAMETKKRGAQLFHLGGGSTPDADNSLFRFKEQFSRSRYHFAVGKLVLNEPIYNELCCEWEQKYPEKKERYKNYPLKYKH